VTKPVEGLTIYGQEMDYATSALARMNMILHDNATAKIWKGNTLADPHWKDGNDNLKTFDFAVANPLLQQKLDQRAGCCERYF
jgi:type I restriction enzyme M protein